MSNLLPFSFTTNTTARRNTFFLDFKNLGEDNLHSLCEHELLHLGIGQTYVVITRYKAASASLSAVESFLLTDRLGIVLLKGVANEIINFLVDYRIFLNLSLKMNNLPNFPVSEK